MNDMRKTSSLNTMAQCHLIQICNLLTKLGQTCESKLIRNLTELKKIGIIMHWFWSLY